MTREELLADLDESVRQFAAANAQRDAETTGLPRPPQVVVNDTQIETEPFNFELNRGGESEALPGGSGASSPPPEPCPSVVSLMFNAVVFDCGCLAEQLGAGWYQNITEDMTQPFNGVAAFLGPRFPPSTCSDCMWFLTIGDVLFLRIREYNGGAVDCSGTATSDTIAPQTHMILRSLAGTWELFAYSPYHAGSGIVGVALFYGTTTNIALPISNTLSCNPVASVLDNPLIDCFFGGGVLMPIGAHGGTATITP